MCGIGGFVGQGFSNRELDSTLRHVCEKLSHRGPDARGVCIKPGVALASTRLAIRDPEKGQQPLEKAGVLLVFNGEIYNTDELRNRCQQTSWKTKSDTEVILEVYRNFGENGFQMLSGMFAFAIWDEKKTCLYLVRDRWGEKPLYYTETKEGIAFASEIGGLTPWKHLNWEWDEKDLWTFLKYSYIPSPFCGWKNIQKLKPGCYLRWEQGSTELKRYHFPKIALKQQSPETLLRTLRKAVRQCAVSDKPIGAFLSGGLDSSTVVALLKEVRGTFPVYSIDWMEKDYSEGSYHQSLCKSLDLPQKVVYCTPEFMAQHFDHIVSLYGEPFGDESMIPTYCIARQAKVEVDVVLTGDGADEFFHGYERYFFNHPTADYFDTFTPVDHPTWTLIFKKEFYYQTFRSPLDYSKEWRIGRDKTLRDRSLRDIISYLPDDILMKVDRATMGVGLEARAPFLLPEVTDIALCSAIDQLREFPKMHGKKLLREAVNKIIPETILLRKKQGFGVPLGKWFQDDLYLWMKERLMYGTLNHLGWFSKKGLEVLCQSPQKHSRALFNLLVLESWMRKNDRLQNNLYKSKFVVH